MLLAGRDEDLARVVELEHGKVVDVAVFSRENNDELLPGDAKRLPAAWMLSGRCGRSVPHRRNT